MTFLDTNFKGAWRLVPWSLLNRPLLVILIVFVSSFVVDESDIVIMNAVSLSWT